MDENKFGCSDDKNVGKAILPLFAFSFLKKLEIQFKNKTISDEIKAKAVEVSLVSGVLCRYTGYDELTKKANDQFIGIYDQSNDPFAIQSRIKSVSNDPFAAQSRNESASNDPFAAQSHNKGADPFTAPSRNESATSDPFEALSQKQVVSNDPLAAPQKQADFNENSTSIERLSIKKIMKLDVPIKYDLISLTAIKKHVVIGMI